MTSAGWALVALVAGTITEAGPAAPATAPPATSTAATTSATAAATTSSGPTAPATPTPASSAAEAQARLFLAPVRSSALDDDARVAVEDALLVALREGGLRVVGSGDLRGVLDVEAVRQATGCDAAGCDAELADALGAPELVTAQIARVGNTWVFTLARLSRGDLGVRARAQRTADGDDPGLLLRLIPGLVRDIAPPEATPPEAPPDAALVVGAVGAGVGVVGAGLWGVSHLLHGEALRLVGRRDFAGAASSAATGRYVYWTGIATTSVGAAVLTAGAAAFLATRVTDDGGAP